eukprot:PhF_6_TR25442/c0_g1_i1/m.35170
MKTPLVTPRGRVLPQLTGTNQWYRVGKYDVFHWRALGSLGLLDPNDYGNTTNHGHFHSKYRVWKSRDPYAMITYQRPVPRLQIAYILPRLTSVPDARSFQSEIHVVRGLLLQCIPRSSVEEICGIVASYNKWGIEEDVEVKSALQARVTTLSRNEAIVIPKYAIDVLEKNGFEVDNSRTRRLVSKVSPRVLEGLQRRTMLLAKVRGIAISK